MCMCICMFACVWVHMCACVHIPGILKKVDCHVSFMIALHLILWNTIFPLNSELQAGRHAHLAFIWDLNIQVPDLMPGKHLIHLSHFSSPNRSLFNSKAHIFLLQVPNGLMRLCLVSKPTFVSSNLLLLPLQMYRKFIIMSRLSLLRCVLSHTLEWFRQNIH